MIDKDRASALLAIEMKADLLMIPTGVERVAIRFGQPGPAVARPDHRREAERYAAEGHFGAGSMGPKIEAMLRFVKARPGGRGVITNVESIARALRGETGTWIERLSEATMETTLLAVNGTLMRGLELNPNLLAVGATFVREDKTEPCYRLWSIDDRHPAMMRTPGEGARVALEVWDVPLAGLARGAAERAAGARDRQGGARRTAPSCSACWASRSCARAARDHRIRRLARLYCARQG